MSDTPISDSTAHNIAELGMLCRKLERELNTANDMFRKLNIHALNLVDRIRRLEEAGDAMTNCIACGCSDGGCTTCRGCEDKWTEAKEDKL